MHTSTLLKSRDFRFIRHASRTLESQIITDSFPAYHEKDRLGIVSPYVEDGLAYSSAAVLALCTAFYDRLRAKERPFFDYPQHFAFMDMNEDGVNTRKGRRPCQMQQLGSAWGHLDVWPETQWIASGNQVEDFLKKIFEFHIHCLFWPEDLIPAQDGPTQKLPSYVKRLLGERLKTVYFYRSETTDIEIKCSHEAHKIINQSRSNLADVLSLKVDSIDQMSSYRQVEPAVFLTRMEKYFLL